MSFLGFGYQVKDAYISKVFREIGLADELGSGMRNTYKYTQLYSGGMPKFIEDDVFRTIIPLTSVAVEKIGPYEKTQVKTQVTIYDEILAFCLEPHSKAEIAKHCGYKNTKSFTLKYLRIEGAFYCGIGCLFLLYGFYRAVKLPGMSVVLTVISLGTRVVLAYALSSIEAIGVTGIWWSVPIGWALADLVGFLYYRRHKKEFFR